MEGENAPLYCICRKPDINCFMILCHDKLVSLQPGAIHLNLRGQDIQGQCEHTLL
ncbi:unnamed protein product [Oreochromis niloticus]|nr:unnamed protein product [Mustela putorius furo]